MHQVYINKCIDINLCIKNINMGQIFPVELIQIIMGHIWHMKSEPIILFITSHKLEPTADLGSNVMQQEFSKIYPGFRYGNIRHEFWGVESDIPYGNQLLAYDDYMIDIMLIPGHLWDNAVINDDIEFDKKIQIFNMRWKNNRLIKDYIHDHVLSYKNDINGYKDWLQNTINNQEFLKIQNVI